MSNSLRPHGPEPARLLSPCSSSGKNTGMGCHFILQRIFLTQGSNPGLLHSRQILYHLNHQSQESITPKIFPNTEILWLLDKFVDTSIIIQRLKAGGEGDNWGWHGWMASPTPWTWVWASSGSWCWTGWPGMLQSMGLQRVGQDWATELNWTII